jgi:hypothetical protein
MNTPHRDQVGRHYFAPSGMTVLSRVVIVIALGASLSEAIFCLMGLGFSGLPDSVMERVVFILGALFWIPAAASWKFPVAGFIAFALLFGVVLAMCIRSHTSIAGCFYSLVFQSIGGAFLMLNFLFVSLVRRRRS